MRRANGTGSITRLGGNRRKPYAVRVSYMDTDGTRKQKYIAFCRTRKEAQQALDIYSSQHPEAASRPQVPGGQIQGAWMPAPQTPAGSGQMVLIPPTLCSGSVMQGMPVCETYVRLADGRLAAVPAGSLQMVSVPWQVPAAGTAQQLSPAQAAPQAAGAAAPLFAPSAAVLQTSQVPGVQRQPTVNDMYELWIKTYSGQWSARTRELYTVNYQRHFGAVRDLPVRDITIDMLQDFFDSKAAAGLGDSSLLILRRIWNAISKEAIKRDYITRNRVADVVLTKQGAVLARDRISEESIEMLFTIAESYEAGGDRSRFSSSADDFSDVALIYAYTGFRQQGLVAMTAESYHPAEGGFLPYLTGGIKTEAGRNRTVPVHPRIQHFVENRIQTYGALTTYGQYGGCRQPGPSQLCSKIRAVLTAAGCSSSATTHWLRHTFASRLNEAGANEAAVKMLLGHSMSDITEHYTHVSRRQLDEAILSLP